MRKLLRSAAVVATVAMLATACSDTTEEETEETTEETSEDTTEDETDDEADDEEAADDEPADEGAVEFAACQVTDTGGVDDRSFNQTAFAGVEQAEAELGVEGRVLESTSEADYEPFLNQFIDDGCDIIIPVGFALDAATQAAAAEHPDQLFAIVDVDFVEFDAEGNFVGDVSFDNVRELTYATDEAAFLAGYIAAATTESGVVGTWGGIAFPTVTIFMDGFLAGVGYHNQENGTDVQVLGWDGAEGTFIGNFDSQDDGRNTTDQMIANGADIILPVAGPAGLGAVTAAEDAGNVQVIWVDTDGRVSVPDSADVFLTSVQKKMDLTVFESIELAYNDNWEGGLYVGTLENGGVGIPEDTVPADLADEVSAIRDAIIAGELSVDPADY